MILAVAALTCAFAVAQDVAPEIPEPASRPTLADPTLPDPALSDILKALAGVTSNDPAALSGALHATGSNGPTTSPATPNRLVPIVGFDDGGGPNLLLQWALPDSAAPDLAPDPDSKPAWNLYLLSWDGSKWVASRLLSGVEDFTSEVINLGPPTRNAIAIVVLDAVSHEPYPVIFDVKEHSAALLWDGQADDSRYAPLLQAEISFLNHQGAPTEMLVTGRADPGFFQVARNGKRGFTARTHYVWRENAFVPERTDYTPSPDYTLYRFISALHLHQYAAAYALIVPAKFMKTNSPSVDKFRQFLQQNWPEFLGNEIFTAPELSPGSPDEHLFLLEKTDKHLAYHPAFSHDGKFRITGLTRTVEVVPAENEIKN